MAQSFNLTAQINLQAPANLKTVVAQIRREFGSVSADVKVNISPQSARSIDNVKNRLDALNASLVQAKNNTTSLDAALRGLAGSLSGVQSNFGKVESTISKTSTSVAQTAKSIKVASTEMEEFGKQSALAIRRFAAFSLVTSGVFALINAVQSGFKAFVEFDKELVKLQQVTGKGAIGLQSLEKEITNLSTSLGVSSQSLMSVASTLAQAGLSADDTRIALSALAKTELAPSFDNLTDTTEGAIAAIRQFGLDAKDLEKALGSINAVAAAYAVESKDIIAAIQRTGGVFAASSKGVSEGTDALNEFIAVFTSVRQTTRESAETIATGLRTIFTRLQRAKTIDQLKEYGVTLTDLEGKFVGPFEAVKRLSAALNQLDPRDLRFSSIVEELGGFRQIGKVIPLIQQFKVAQEALGVAQKGQGSLYEAQITAQKSLANQIAKVREQFLALIRDIGKSQSFQGLFKVVTGLASGLISLASAFKPILPILAIMGAIKGVSAIRQFGSGFIGGLSKGGGAKGVGTNVGETLSGAKEKEKEEVRQKANAIIAENTSAIKTLTTTITQLITSTNNLGSSINNRASGGSTFNSGGIVRKFARGGLVPGSGNGDTVPAMLEPGEFVIRKKAVQTLGASSLQNINRYADGGPILAEDSIGAAVLRGRGTSRRSTITAEEIVATKRNEEEKNVLQTMLGNKSYTLVKQPLSKVHFPEFDKAINIGLKDGVNSATKVLADKLKAPVPAIRKSGIDNFIASINDGAKGAMFENILSSMMNGGKWDSVDDPRRPFDFENGMGTTQSLFPDLIMKYVDAKASMDAADKSGMAKKIANQLTYNPDTPDKNAKIEQQVLEVFESLPPGRTVDLTSLTGSRPSGGFGLSNLRLDILEKMVSSGQLVKNGRYYQKLASGGIAKAPLIDDILQASGAMLPKPSDAIQALIEAGGGALDVDRTLKRTLGDKAYSSAPSSNAKQAVLSKYFRDDKQRLEDMKSAPLTAFGKELISTIKSGTLNPKSLSIISKSQRTKGVPEYLHQIFGIPVENMVFTQGGDKQPALDAIRSKGPRVNRVRKFLGGLIQKFKLGGEVYDLQNGTGLSNGEFDQLVKFANTNDFSMDEFKTYLAQSIQQKKNKAGLRTDPAALLRTLIPESPTASQQQLDLANMLKGPVDAKWNPKYDNARKPFAAGGSVEDTVPALLTPGEFVINKKAAQKIGYAKLSRMNQADRVQGYNKGGIVGGIQRFFRGGQAEKDAVRGQGRAIADIKDAEKTFAIILGSMAKNIRNTVVDKFKGIEAVDAGQQTSMGNYTFSDKSRGVANINTRTKESLMGLQIRGAKTSATTETVAHEAGHLADYALTGKQGFASETEGTFQFELIKKIKPVMEKAFQAAGHSAEDIAKYLADNKELFGEFFAKASPEVRNILTSTIDAKAGMQALADHLGDAGYTYAGLEASDIDPSRAKKSSVGSKMMGGMSNVLGSIGSKVSSIFRPKTSSTGPAIGGPPDRPPWPEDLMPLTTGVKSAEADRKQKEQQAFNDSQFFEYKARKEGITSGAFRLNVARRLGKAAYDVRDNFAGRKEEMGYELAGQQDKFTSLKSSLDSAGSDQEKDLIQARIKEEVEALANQMKMLRPSIEGADEAAKAMTEALMSGNLKEAQDKLKEALGDIPDKAEAMKIAMEQMSKELGVSQEMLQRNFGADNKDVKRQQFVQSREGQRFGALAEFAPDMLAGFSGSRAGRAVGGAADFISGKGGKFSQAFSRMGGLTAVGGGLSVAADQLQRNVTISDPTNAGIVGGIGGAGSGLASGALLGGQIAGPVGAMIGGVTGALIGAINGAVNSFQTKKLENNLKALDKASGDLDTAFKKLESSSTAANRQEVQQKINTKIGAVATLGGQANLGAGGTARTITETLRALDITGLTSTLTGQQQEGEARQAMVSGIQQIVADADRLGSVELSKASSQNIGNLLDRSAGMNPAEKELTMARANQSYQVLAAGGMNENDIFLSKFIAQQKQQGRTEDQISKDLADPKARERAIQSGKELLAVEGEIALKQALLARTAQDVAVATEQLIDVYRRGLASLDRYSQELEKFSIGIDNSVGDLTGNARIKPVDRTNEQILGNISAFSKDEVIAAAEQTASIAGGGDSGNKLKNEIVAAKILKDELPKALRDATGNDPREIIDVLKKGFEGTGVAFSESLQTQISEKLQEKLASRQNGGSLSDLEEASGGILESLAKGPEEALKFGQQLQAKYNDTIQKSIDKLEQYNDQVGQAEELQRKATSIRINAEVELATALGNSPTLDQLNSAFDTEVRSMTSSLVPGGTTNPAEISAAQNNARAQIAEIQSRLDTKDTSYTGTEDEKIAAMSSDVEALNKQKKALNDGNKALEKLANSGEKASNALSKIKERQQLADNGRSLARRLLTSDGGELMDFNRQMSAYTKVITGKASGQELGNLQTRQDAFAGFDNIKSVLPEGVARRMEATLARKMIEANPQGKQILESSIGVDSQGRPMSVDEMLKNAEDGTDPVQEQYIQAYRDATALQADAATALADNALEAARLLKEGAEAIMNKLGDLQNVLPRAQAEAQSAPKPETKKEEPTEGVKQAPASVNTVQMQGVTAPSNDNNIRDSLTSIGTTTAVVAGGAYGVKKASGLVTQFRGAKETTTAAKAATSATTQAAGAVDDVIAVADKAKDAKTAASTASKASQAVKGAKGALAAVRGGAVAAGGGAAAAAAPLVAANTGFSIVSNVAEAAMDPSAYDAKMRAKVEAGDQRGKQASMYSLSGAAEGALDPAGKIVEGAYTVGALGGDVAGAISSGAKTTRMEENSRKNNQYGLTASQNAQARDEANWKLQLEQANASGDTVKAAQIQKDLQGLDNRKIESGARTDNWFTADQDMSQYTQAVSDYMASIKTEAEAAKKAIEESKPVTKTEESASKEEVKAAEQPKTETPKTEEVAAKEKTVEEAKKAEDSLDKATEQKPIYMAVLEKIASLLATSKMSSPATATKSTPPEENAAKQPGAQASVASQTNNQIRPAVVNAQTTAAAASSVKPQTEPLTRQQTMKMRMLMVSNRDENQEAEFQALRKQKIDSDPRFAAKATQKNEYRELNQLKSKGKLRVSEEGLPIGRSPEEEKRMAELQSKQEEYKNDNLTPREKQRKANKENYLADKQQKRQNFLSRFRPEVAANYMTDEEKETAKAQAQVASAIQTSGTPEATRGQPVDFSNYSYSQPTYEEIKAAEARGDYAVRPNAANTPAFAAATISGQSPDLGANFMQGLSGASLPTGPIPTSLPTQTMSQQTGSGPQQTQQNSAATPTMITLDPTTLEAMTSFNQTFGGYVKDLASITIPDKVTISGAYTVDLKITGAAAIEALDKKIREVGETFVSASDFSSALNKLRDEVSSATKNAVKSSASVGNTSQSG
jgi:hypothetical protein